MTLNDRRRAAPSRITDAHRRAAFRPEHDRVPGGDPVDYGYISDVIAENRRFLNLSA